MGRLRWLLPPMFLFILLALYLLALYSPYMIRNLKAKPQPKTNQSFQKGSLALAPPTDSKELAKVRVLCWVMTSPLTLRSKAKHVKSTWGPRCDVTLYMSSKTDPEFPAVGLNVPEGRQNLWKKTQAAFSYVYRHHYQDADWFMKADDDTYVIVENLRKFLRDKNSSAPVYYGHKFTEYVRQGYMSGGAGYVLSKEALRRFGQQGGTVNQCKQNCPWEDVGMGHCMQSLGVVTGDSRDAHNRIRFVSEHLGAFVDTNLAECYQKYKKYGIAKGPMCGSDYLISCHNVAPRDMHLLDFVVYHLRSANGDGRRVYNIEGKN